MFPQKILFLLTLVLISAYPIETEVVVQVNNLCAEKLNITTSSIFLRPTPFDHGLMLESQESVNATFDGLWAGWFYADDALSGATVGVLMMDQGFNSYGIQLSDKFVHGIRIIPPGDCSPVICTATPCYLREQDCSDAGIYNIDFCPENSVIST